QTAQQKQVEARIKELADRHGARQGLDRRRFLRTSCGMAAAFLAMNQVFGDLFDVSEAEAADPARAADRADAMKGQFIFDVQTHFVHDKYSQPGILGLAAFASQHWNPALTKAEQTDLYYYKFENYVLQIFLNSDTSVALLSGAPFDDRSWEFLPNTQIREAVDMGNVVLVEAGDFIPVDGEVIEGVASVNEAAITGESAPVIRESGGDRSSVTGGTQVLSDWLVVKVTADPGEAFLDRMISLVEGAKRQKTPNEIALDILLAAMTIIFLLATATLLPFSLFSVQAAGQGTPVTVTVLVALLVCLIPTTIGALLSAIGIAGMDRMIQKNVIAMSRSEERRVGK